MRSILFLAIVPLLSSCAIGTIASTAVDVVTLPVKAVAAGVDAATTSQAEADQKRGREIRKREERLGKLQREFDKLQGKCLKGDRRACEKQATVRARMDATIPTLPYEGD
jgi:hypothetical protein